MTDVVATTPATLAHARQIALNEGLHYVYTGNVHDVTGDTTFCPICNHAGIVRDWYDIRHYDLTPQGACPACGGQIAGRFGKFSRPFGQRRIAVQIHGHP
jgi:pyruvate formate lyase activating enzyme